MRMFIYFTKQLFTEDKYPFSKLHFQLGKPLRQTQFHSSLLNTIFSSLLRENNLSVTLWKYISPLVIMTKKSFNIFHNYIFLTSFFLKKLVFMLIMEITQIIKFFSSVFLLTVSVTL